MTNDDYMTKSPELLKLKLALNQFQQQVSAQDEEEGGSEGGTGTSGSGGAVVEKQLFVEVYGMVRHGEKQFGVAHDFDQAKYLNKDNKQFQDGLGHESGLKSHPILSQLAKFDGDTPNMSVDPVKNPDAQERYENRLKLRLAAQNRHQHVATPRPGGM